MPPTLDDVFADALAKEPNTRTATVADLADGFGRAYGLQGSHLEWAYMPEQQLESDIQVTLPALMAARPASLRPLSSPPDDVFADDGFIMGVPQKKPTGLYIGIGVGAALVLATIVLALVLL